MFSTALTSVPPFAGGMYDNLTSHWVEGDTIGMDVTACATMRCLLRNRRGEDCYRVAFVNSAGAYQKNASNTRLILTQLTDGRFSSVPLRHLIIVNNPASAEGLAEIATALESAAENPWNQSASPACSSLPAVENYIKNKTGRNCKAYVFAELKSAVIFTRSLDMRALHLLVSFIPLYFPALFKEHPLTEEEKEMLMGLTKNTKNAYLKAIYELGADSELEMQIMDETLRSFEKRNQETMINTAKQEIDSLEAGSEKIYVDYVTALRKIAEATVRYEGLKAQAAQGKDPQELLDYFHAHKNIKIVGAEGTKFEIIVNTFIDTFDVNGYNHIKSNEEIYRGYDGPSSNIHTCFQKKSNRAMLMDHLFSEDPELKIKTCAYYRLNSSESPGREVESCASYDYVSKWPACVDRIPNPHLDMHNCIGQNRPLIAKQYLNGELLGAIECCVASAMAVNVHETSATFRPFMQQIFSSSDKILFNTVTHEDMTPEEALLWLLEKYGKAAPAEEETVPADAAGACGAEGEAAVVDEDIPF